MMELTRTNMEGEQPQDSEYLDDEGTLNPDLLIIFEYAQYICLILSIFGFLLNSYVLVRLIAKAYANVELFIDGSGLPLATMAVADLLSLLLVFLIIIFGTQELSQSTIVIPCKICMFLIHTMTGVSIWCWMVASGLRYLAVYHPFWNTSRLKLGQRAIFAIVIISIIMNIWLLIAVDADAFRCTESNFLFNNNYLNRSLHAAEIGWSYLAPALLAGFLDLRVFLIHASRKRPSIRLPEAPNQETTRIYRSAVFHHQKSRLSDESEESTCTLVVPATPRLLNRKPIRRSQADVARSAVGRWLLITGIGLLLNAPDIAIRLLTLVGLLCEDCVIQWDPTESRLVLSIVIIARLLYFAQFSFNAVFLTVVIYGMQDVRLPPTPTPSQRTSTNNCASLSSPLVL